MSVPLDRLYHFLHDHCDRDVIIYHFFPHGSKKPENIKPLHPNHKTDPAATYLNVPVLFHDQEPLQFDDWASIPDAFKIPGCPHSRLKPGTNRFSIYDKLVLVHSELNSTEVEKFEEDGIVPAYYWSHALIARDWFRYAEHDQQLKNKDLERRFLIYNRAWQGSREYRLKFAELLVEYNLQNDCLTSFNPIDSDKHYTQHNFANSCFALNRQDLEQHFPTNSAPSWASADYDVEDYQRTEIEVVLETLFDDSRQHITEKTLRAIATGQPFILCSTPQSLKYLQSYGFETFNQCWDESYDNIQDPAQRLAAIVDLMAQLKTADLTKAKQIATRNQQRFFSKQFVEQVVAEFSTNISVAIQQTMQNQSCAYFIRHYNQAPAFKNIVPESVVTQVQRIAKSVSN